MKTKCFPMIFVVLLLSTLLEQPVRPQKLGPEDAIESIRRQRDMLGNRIDDYRLYVKEIWNADSWRDYREYCECSLYVVAQLNNLCESIQEEFNRLSDKLHMLLHRFESLAELENAIKNLQREKKILENATGMLERAINDRTSELHKIMAEMRE